MKHSDFPSVQTRTFAVAHARLDHETPMLWETWYQDAPVSRWQVSARSSSRADLAHWNGAHRTIVRK